MEIEEKGVKLRLTIVDTPGFNDAVNAEERYLNTDQLRRLNHWMATV